MPSQPASAARTASLVLLEPNEVDNKTILPQHIESLHWLSVRAENAQRAVPLITMGSLVMFRIHGMVWRPNMM